MQKGECNLNKPYHSVLNMSSLSVLMLPYHVYFFVSHHEVGAVLTSALYEGVVAGDFNKARCECLDAFM